MMKRKTRRYLFYSSAYVYCFTVEISSLGRNVSRSACLVRKTKEAKLKSTMMTIPFFDTINTLHLILLPICALEVENNMQLVESALLEGIGMQSTPFSRG